MLLKQSYIQFHFHDLGQYIMIFSLSKIIKISIQVAASNSSWWGIQMWYIALGTKELMAYGMFTLVYYMYYSKTIIDRLGLFQWDEQLIIILYDVDAFYKK